MKKQIISIFIAFALIGAVGCKKENEGLQSEIENSNLTITSDATDRTKDENVELEEQKIELSDDKTNVSMNQTIEIKASGDQDVITFIPDGWHILKKHSGLQDHQDELAIAEGDLNKDGINDKVLVIEESMESDSPRKLIVLLGNEDHTYTLALESQKAILLACDGGGFGDPFEDITVDRGSILIKFFGGSSRGHAFYRFRYQKDGWYLIGYTEGSYIDTGIEMVVLEEDYNLLTGDYEIDTLEEGEIQTTKGNRGKKPLLNLKDFIANEADISQF